ncbi:alpha/beta hydrolase [Micromonosporaceae bacterium Da 78-11]
MDRQQLSPQQTGRRTAAIKPGAGDRHGTMGQVFRRTVLKIVALSATATLGACTSAPKPTAPTAPTATSVPTAAPTSPAGISQTPKRAPTKTFTLGVRTLKLARGDDRPLPTTVWYPKTGGPFPLILFSHGLTARPADYADLLTTWAKAGFVVAFVDGRRAYDAVKWPKAFLTVTDGRHVTTDADFGVVATTTTDFWRWTLYGDRAAKARLPKDATKGGIATPADRL